MERPLRVEAKKIMLETLFVGIAALIGVGLLLVGVVLLPILLVVLFVKLLVFLIVLPFRLFGAVAGVAGTLFGMVGKLLLALAGLAFGMMLLVGGLLAIPLLPLLLLGGLIWLVVGLMRPRRSRQPASRVQIEGRPV